MRVIQEDEQRVTVAHFRYVWVSLPLMLLGFPARTLLYHRSPSDPLARWTSLVAYVGVFSLFLLVAFLHALGRLAPPGGLTRSTDSLDLHGNLSLLVLELFRGHRLCHNPAGQHLRAVCCLPFLVS